MAEEKLAILSSPSRSTKPRVWTRQQLRVFLDSVEGDRWRPAFELAVATGLRRSELLGLTWDNVTLKPANGQNPSLAVVKTLVEVGSKPTLVNETKTKHSRRLVELAPETVEVMRGHRKRQIIEQIVVGCFRRVRRVIALCARRTCRHGKNCGYCHNGALVE